MAEATVPYGRRTQKEPAVKEVHVLWITAGLSCDGDSVAVTGATQPSIEDIILGAIPGLPKAPPARQSRKPPGGQPPPCPGPPSQPGGCLRGRRRVHGILAPGRRRS